MLNPPLSVLSTAKALGVSHSTVVRLIKTGRLGYVRLGDRRIGVPEAEISKYLERQFVPAQGQALVTRSRAGGRA
jgi:excisionase family DNA binding protein